MEQSWSWWTSYGGTVIVEQAWRNSHGGIIVSFRSDDGEILRRQTWSRGLGVRSPWQWREK